MSRDQRAVTEARTGSSSRLWASSAGPGRAARGLNSADSRAIFSMDRGETLQSPIEGNEAKSSAVMGSWFQDAKIRGFCKGFEGHKVPLGRQDAVGADGRLISTRTPE